MQARVLQGGKTVGFGDTTGNPASNKKPGTCVAGFKRLSFIKLIGLSGVVYILCPPLFMRGYIRFLC